MVRIKIDKKRKKWFKGLRRERGGSVVRLALMNNAG